MFFNKMRGLSLAFKSGGFYQKSYLPKPLRSIAEKRNLGLLSAQLPSVFETAKPSAYNPGLKPNANLMLVGSRLLFVLPGLAPGWSSRLKGDFETPKLFEFDPVTVWVLRC